MNHTINLKIEITDEDINGIMSAAMQGIAYWCDEAYIRGFIKAEDDGMYTSEALTKGYRIAIHDMEENKWHQLTLNKFLNGIALHGKRNFDEWDMYDADSVIQYALFGKQVYA